MILTKKRLSNLNQRNHLESHHLNGQRNQKNNFKKNLLMKLSDMMKKIIRKNHRENHLIVNKKRTRKISHGKIWQKILKRNRLITKRVRRSQKDQRVRKKVIKV
jgi:hypothetical protein